MGDGGLPLGSLDLQVEMGQPSGYVEADFYSLEYHSYESYINIIVNILHLIGSDRVQGEVVVEGALLHVVCDEPELGAGPVVLVVRGDEPQDVIVTQHAGLVHLYSRNIIGEEQTMSFYKPQLP